ncbi:MAG: GTPase ObgE [Clostridia bacterium]
MDFIDKTTIVVRAGSGGDGFASFHREKYVNRGGPDGGDGGRGGNVVFLACDNANTLLDFKFRRHFFAENGEKGAARMCSGKNGEDIIIKVPAGTIVRDKETGVVIADMNRPGKERIVLYGGRGGKGNARFATPTKQVPRFAQNGQKMKERELELELQIIADVGLIGLPNVGKSTVLAALTAAKPKIANYHFTTLSPNLGVVAWKDKSFVLADIPGLIEGAAEGVGLGHDFLRHIERTRLLVHTIDISGSENRDPIEDYRTVNNELTSYSERLAKLPQIVLCNKMDIDGAEENFLRFKNEVNDVSIYSVSAASRVGFESFLDEILFSLSSLPKTFEYEESEIEITPEYGGDFTVSRDNDIFIIEGGLIKYILDTTDAFDDESMRRFQQLLIKEGVIKKLKALGAKEGSTVKMGEWEFDFVD